MDPVRPDEVLNIADYERARPSFRTMVLVAKELRRIPVGEHFTLLFENHLTVLYQVQEMARTERIVADAAIAHEVQTYNELIPPPGELCATLLIEYTDPAERERRLGELVGIEHHLSLRVGDLPPVVATFDARQMNDEKVSAVQYIGFPVGAAHRAAWKDEAAAGRVRLVVDHPAYKHEHRLSTDQAAALAEDLGM